MSPENAKKIGVKDKQIVKVKAGDVRALVFDKVLVRIREDFRLDFHIDTDEANAALVLNGDEGEIIVE